MTDLRYPMASGRYVNLNPSGPQADPGSSPNQRMRTEQELRQGGGMMKHASILTGARNLPWGWPKAWDFSCRWAPGHASGRSCRQW